VYARPTWAAARIAARAINPRFEIAKQYIFAGAILAGIAVAAVARQLQRVAVLGEQGSERGWHAAGLTPPFERSFVVIHAGRRFTDVRSSVIPQLWTLSQLRGPLCSPECALLRSARRSKLAVFARMEHKKRRRK
jgi:hypothetical protein